MGKRGPKLKQIDQKAFESLCALQCTQEEISDFFGVDHKTIDRWCKDTYNEKFSRVFAQKRGGGKVSLRRKQWKLADTSAAMAIFLGKNMLGQRDKFDVDAEVSGSVTVNITGEDELPD